MRKIGQLFLLLTACLLICGQASALSPEDFNSLYGDSEYYWSSQSPAACETSTSLVGNDNEEKAWNFFKAKGLDDMHAAAVVGNMMLESHFDPEIMQIGGRSQNPADADPLGWGIAQWTPGSKIIGIASGLGINGPIYELGTQLDIVWAEMTGTSPTGQQSMVTGLNQQTTLADAVSYFQRNFEGGTNYTARYNYAVEALQQYGGANNGASAPSLSSVSSGCAASASPDCTNVTGNALILCNAKQYDVVDYVWGGGHAGGAAYHQACPQIRANDTACGLDCSGLVSVALYDTYRTSGSWSTTTIVSDHANWQEIRLTQLRPGDVIEPDPGHVEIVDHVSGNTIYTFGAHTDSLPQPDQVGPAQYSAQDSYRYFRYVGPGAS